MADWKSLTCVLLTVWEALHFMVQPTKPRASLLFYGHDSVLSALSSLATTGFHTIGYLGWTPRHQVLIKRSGHVLRRIMSGLRPLHACIVGNVKGVHDGDSTNHLLQE
jgi:hypothetical protein